MKILILIISAFGANLIDMALAFAQDTNIQRSLTVNWTGLSQDGLTLLILSAVGALGGYLSAIRKRTAGLELNTSKHTWFMGCKELPEP
jgi:hypothetical protein